ncbi:MAG TPA: FliH/SctL family protein [Xanthobacteraceae bacterium]|nr:FliH/SctL family protein [Xanthobacteraceae bacterium]
MAAPAKFLFNADFAPNSGAERPLTPAELDAKFAEVEANGFRKGAAAAEAEASAEARRRSTAALESIGAATAALAKSLDALEVRLETEAVEVAVAVGRKLANELIAREPMAEIAALASDCFKQLVAAPHVVVRVNDSLQEFASTRLNEIARNRGFEGRLVVLAEPEIAPGDCRIEWADGGLTRDKAAVDALIADVVARYIAARKTQTN